MVHTFEATVEKGRGGGAWVTVPFSVEEVLGTRGQVKVVATFDGHPYRGSLAPMGGGRHVLGIKKEIRQAIDKSIGDTVTVTIEPDTAPRQVEIPDDLLAALDARPGARQAFEQLPFSHRREYVEAIEEAKRPETRVRRIARTVDSLTES